MINTQLKFEGKIPKVQKLLHSQGITKHILVKGQFDLGGHGQGSKFSNPSEILDKQFKLEGKILEV